MQEQVLATILEIKDSIKHLDDDEIASWGIEGEEHKEMTVKEMRNDLDEAYKRALT